MNTALPAFNDATFFDDGATWTDRFEDRAGGWQMPSYDDYLRAKYPREPEPEPEIPPEPPKPFAPVEIDLPPLGEIAIDPLAALHRAIYAAQRPSVVSFRRPPHVDTDDEEILLLM